MNNFLKDVVVCQNDIKIKSLPKDKAQSLLINVVEPFYNRVLEDNKVANFISNEMLLFKLKIRQASFTIKFLTDDIENIELSLHKIITAHKNISLKMDYFLPYFFIWADVLILWLKENQTLSSEELCAWKYKILRIYATLSLGHLYNSDLSKIQKVDTMLQEKIESKVEDKTIDLEKIAGMHKSDAEKISAREFRARVEVDIYFLDELRELNSDLINAFHHSDSKSLMDLIASITIVIFKYAKLLGGFMEFRELSYALNSLVNLLEKQKVENFHEVIQNKLLRFLEAVVEDLANWQNVIFYTQETNDIHYLDASIFSSCAQLEMLFSNDTSNDGEIELF